MFKGLTWLVLKTKLNLTKAQKSTIVRSGSVHKTNCKGRTVIEPQLSPWKHQDCAAIAGTATQVGQNETPPQIYVNKPCRGNPSERAWRFVSICSLTYLSDFNYRPSPYSQGFFPRSITAGSRGWLLTSMPWWKSGTVQFHTPRHPRPLLTQSQQQVKCRHALPINSTVSNVHFQCNDITYCNGEQSA
jgi:hypothetical protein